MTLTPKERALNKTKIEISKDILRVIEMSALSGLGELQYFLYYLHISRLIPTFGNVPESGQHITGIYVRQLDDAYKYIIQIIVKHGRNRHLKTASDSLLINLDLVHSLTKSVLNINSKFETLSFLTMFNNLEVSGERDQNVKINLKEITEDERSSKFLYYGVRADMENDRQKENQKKKNDFLEYFRSEYAPYSDLFLKEFNVSIDDFIELVDWMVETVILQSKKNEKDFTHLENGNVDVQDYKTVMLFSVSMFLKKETLRDEFGEKFNKILHRLIFKTDEFDEQQLKYNLIARQPIINKNDYFIISPEILLDSLFVNSHYSLLEASAVKEEYKARYSKVFVDKISNIAKEEGFEEFTRDFELYEGRDQIGDLDIILKNCKNEFLLIEAKNHSIPMDVYFHDLGATERRLTQLANEWEKKVDKRKKHLDMNYLKYGIGPNFRYIIVTKTPEIISHFSAYLILSLDEFKHWIKRRDIETTFDDIFKSVYNLDSVSFTEKQLATMQDDLSTGWRFEKE
jgi:hypothetical protein